MKINANSLRAGNIIEHDGKLWVIAKQPDHTKPGKGPAYIQVEMKQLKTGTKLNHRFGSTDNIEKVRLDQRNYQYLYMEDKFLTLMDPESYEQITIDKGLLGDRLNFIQDGMELVVESYNDEPINITLPETVILEVSETEPVVKGQTAASSYKPAILENGVRVMVPPFIDPGVKIVVKIENLTYVERAKS
jgi:elongation factor P